MKDFFMKYVNSFEPQDAIELMHGRLHKIKELVWKGEDPIEELRELSDMIDDYVQYSGGAGKGQKPGFNPQQYYKPGRYGQNSYSPKNEYPNTYQGHYPGYRPPIYPYIFPFGQGGQDQDQDGQRPGPGQGGR